MPGKRGPGSPSGWRGTSQGAWPPIGAGGAGWERSCTPSALPVLLAAAPRAGSALPRCSLRLSPSFCHPRPSVSPPQAAAPPRCAADPARGPAASRQRGGRKGDAGPPGLTAGPRPALGPGAWVEESGGPGRAQGSAGLWPGAEMAELC